MVSSLGRASFSLWVILAAGCSAGGGDGGGPRRDGGPPADAGPGADGGAERDGGGGGGDGGGACRCGPGAACVDGACVDDCRLPRASSCDVGRLCAEMTGRCVMPGEDCTPAGEFVPCGSAEFAPTCGPGSTCDGARCVAAAGCAGVVCDAVGICRGIGCAGAAAGTVTGVDLDPIADAVRATPDGIHAMARVGGAGFCGLTATFEVRVETAIYTSAGNDATVWEVDLATGMKTPYATGIPIVFGLATDPTGALYVLRGDTCEVGRIDGAPGARTFTPLAVGPSNCSRLAIGPDGALYATGDLWVTRIDLFTFAVTDYGSISDGIAAWDSTFLTGLAFAPDGTLVVGEHWRSLLRIPAGGGPGTFWADAPDLVMTSSDNPWNEGMAFAPDGSLWVGVFPSNNLGGFVYRVAPDGTASRRIGLAEIRAAVPATMYAGIHGVAFGLDGAMYFTNQNTSGATREPFGQLLVQRTTGEIQLVEDGFNFDWPRGYDGDLIVGTRVTDSVTASIAADGTTEARLDVPDVAGAYQVRVFVTDPTSGRVYSDASAARTL